MRLVGCGFIIKSAWICINFTAFFSKKPKGAWWIKCKFQTAVFLFVKRAVSHAVGVATSMMTSTATRSRNRHCIHSRDLTEWAEKSHGKFGESHQRHSEKCTWSGECSLLGQISDMYQKVTTSESHEVAVQMKNRMPILKFCFLDTVGSSQSNRAFVFVHNKR